MTRPDEPTTGRVPPHDLEAERALLGAALIYQPAAEVVAALDTATYYRPAHGHIAAAVTALVEAGEPVDAITVADRLAAGGLLDAAGGRSALAELIGAGGTTSRASVYAEVIARHAATRRIMRAAQEVLDVGYEGAAEPAELLETARRLLDTVPSAVGSTLQWADVEAIIAGGVEATITPDLFLRDDGAALLYLGRVHFLQGEPSSGKGWVALTACAQVMALGGTAVYLDLEDTDAGIISRLLALGVAPAVMVERFRLVRPGGPLGPGELAELEAATVAANADLVIVDGLAEALAADGVDENSNTEVTGWLKRVVRRLAEGTGAAVVVIDHVSKSKEDRGRWARGAGAKLAALTGVAYAVEVREPFAARHAGQVDLVVSKDRPGGVGPTGTTAAHFHIEPSAGGALVATRVVAPSPDEVEGKPTSAMTHVSGVVAGNPGLSRRQVAASHRGGFTAQTIERAVDALIGAGHLHAERRGRSVILTSLRPYPDPDGEPATLLTDEPYEEF